jgi:hypothetical protein
MEGKVARKRSPLIEVQSKYWMIATATELSERRERR